jgi:hypothetical protein
MDATLKELSVKQEISVDQPAEPAIISDSSTTEAMMPLLFRSASGEVFTPPPTQSADDIFAHMSAYMGNEQAA